MSSNRKELIWDRLLSSKRERRSHGTIPDDHRSPFENDYQRIILSASSAGSKIRLKSSSRPK